MELRLLFGLLQRTTDVMHCDEAILREMLGDPAGQNFGHWVVRLIEKGGILKVNLRDGRTVKLDEPIAASAVLESLGWISGDQEQ